MRIGQAILTMLALGTAASGAADDTVRFEQDIQPIFSRHCIVCHGATESNGGLGLGDRDSALKELDSGLHGIVPGQPDESELLRRVMSDDLSERMPPKGEALSAAEIDLLRRWIAQGAEWPPHWAYRPLIRPTPPALAQSPDADWTQTPIDRFVLQSLEERGLRPSTMADKQTWLRRVTYDLIGLPPTAEEQAAFLADDSPDAFERAADRLLASSHYGERWARHWMDLVHYAETHGHDQDRPRPNAWPYRDYLIRALNEDKSYGQFVKEQIAGDVLAPLDPQAIVATGFLATGPWDESSLRDIQENTLDRQIARNLDRDDIVTTVMATFASSTVHCARCHDHKFDPIPQAEYYALQAVFAATDKAERPYDPDPQVAQRRRELLDHQARLPALQAAVDPSLFELALQAEVAAWEQQVAASGSIWTVLDPDTFSTENGATLTEQSDHSLLSSGNRPEKEIYEITAHTDVQGITGIRLELLTDESLPLKGPGRQDNANLHLNEFKLTAAPRTSPFEPQPVVLQNPRADFDQQGWTVAMAIDGNPATAWGIYPAVGQPHRAVFSVREPIRFDGGTTLTFRLEQTHGGGHLIGRLRLSVTTVQTASVDAETLPADITSILHTPAPARTPQQQAELAVFYLGQQITQDLGALPPQQMVYAGSNDFPPDRSFRPAETPREIHVLHRGDVQQPRELAEPGALSCLPQLASRFTLANPNDEGARRAALADWLADPRNALVWRSIANRVWLYHFGRGLVDTPNDFGRMGATPTHPELLDWLATELQQSGGSLKHLHRLIVTSAVYRQSSRLDAELPAVASDATQPSATAAQRLHVDADNRYLWRMNRSRLDAESIHDSLLQITGQLDRTMGGPSVKQFIQTPGIHVTPNVDYRSFDVDDPANTRRSVYRFIFRTLPDPFMESLDCPDASQLTPDRSESVTALQALAMLNNKFIIRQSEHLATRIAHTTPDPTQQIHALYQLVLKRAPDQDELAAFTTYTTSHGLTNACRVLLNSNEFIFVD